MKSLMIFSFAIYLLLWFAERLTGLTSIYHSLKEALEKDQKLISDKKDQAARNQNWLWGWNEHHKEFLKKQNVKKDTFPVNGEKIRKAEQNQQVQQSKIEFDNKNKLDLKKKLQKYQKIELTYKDYLRETKPNVLVDYSDHRADIYSEAYTFREQTYKNTLKEINLHNSDLKKSFAMGLNKFVDFTNEQFKMRFPNDLPPRRQLSVEILRSKEKLKQQEKQLLKNANISLKNKSGLIHDTGICISSYAFSALETIWININIKTQKINNTIRFKQFFSVQQIISCMKPGQQSTVYGCKGGRASDVFQYVMKFGIITQQKYPYNINTKQNGVTSQCQEQTRGMKSSKFWIKDYHIIYNNCGQMIKKLLQMQSLTSLIISTPKLRNYSNGIYISDYSQNKIQIQYQSVTIIGYEPVFGQRAFLFKNSWGETWGIGGYGYVGLNMGVCEYPSYPIFLQ